MRLAGAKARLADRGHELRLRYRATADFVAGTVIAQSRRVGAGVDPATAITLVIAKAPPPPPPTRPPAASTPSRNCEPSYPGVCLDPAAEDYDCAGGSGNGPKYVQGPVQVRGADPFDLDSDGDGVGCERD
jgi:beta-lactam-binding protein with PASTA domain